MKKIAAAILVVWSALVCTAFAPFYVPAINVVSAPSNPCASLDSSTVALVARMTVDPGCPRKLVINNLIVSLKTAGVWSKLDVLYLFAAHNSQAALLNWVSTSHNATAVNSPAFTADYGFTGNGSNAYIDANFNPSTVVGANFVRNSAHISVRVNDRVVNYNYAVGSDNNRYNILVADYFYGGYANYSMASSIPSGAVAVTNSVGLWLARRSASNATNLFVRGSVVQTSTQTSSAVDSTAMYFLRYVNNYFGNGIASGSIGGSLTDTEVADFNTAISTYMTAVGL